MDGSIRKRRVKSRNRCTDLDSAANLPSDLLSSSKQAATLMGGLGESVLLNGDGIDRPRLAAVARDHVAAGAGGAQSVDVVGVGRVHDEL